MLKKHKKLLIMCAIVAVVCVAVSVLTVSILKGNDKNNIEKIIMSDIITEDKGNEVFGFEKEQGFDSLQADLTTVKILEKDEKYVTVEIKAPDIIAIAENLDKKYASMEYNEENYSKCLEDFEAALKSDDCVYLTNTVKVEYEKTEDGISLIKTDEYYNAISGGVYGIFDSFGVE